MKIKPIPYQPEQYLKIVLAIFLVICMIIPALAQEKTKKKKPEYDVDVSLSTVYDDNILKYSDKYLDRFMNNEDQGRFHIKTYDDIIINPQATISGTFRIFGKQQSVFDVSANYSKYVVNNVKTWSNFGIGYRQYINKKLDFKVFYDYIPEFYVRHFRDDDWTEVYGFDDDTTFTPYVFTKNNYGAWANYDLFNNTRIRFYYYYSQYYHNKHYTEYDSKNSMYRFKLWQDFLDDFTFEFTYQYIYSDAKGYDEPGEDKETSDDGDATYEEDGFVFGLMYRLPRIKKRYHTIEVETVIYNRYYKTEKPVIIDRLHAGRVDNNLRIYVTYYLSASKNWKFKAFYRWLGRESGTTSVLNDEFVSDEKDYKQNQVGLELIYRFGF